MRFGLGGRRGGTPDEPKDVFQEEDEAGSPLSFPEPEAVAVRRRRRRGLLLVLTGLAVLVGIVATLYFSPLLTIRTVAVERNDLLTEERAQELLEPVYGKPLPQVGNRQVEELLAEEAVVDDVIVQGQLPDTLLVEVLEHAPVAEVHQEEEILFYNEHGDVIRTFGEDESSQTEGYATPEISTEAALEDEAVFGAIVSVLGSLPEEARESMDSATAESIDSVQLVLEDGRTIMWGGDERSQEKAAVLEALLSSEAEEFTGAETIDISTPDTPITQD